LRGGLLHFSQKIFGKAHDFKNEKCF
jgi:hypothetical protein